ncbi:MAG: NAD(P)/FAD-dependent oxidoreductase [Rubrivivax sp.]|jgi:L-2-hydroxyglutarate oxidase LhgO|nr:NAD(P)/FAD-dependent oxidoreductase [Rubrivivax sp.]
MGSVDEVECLVVGAGVVGLAASRALAMAGREVLIAEREPLYGSGTSSRNSEVIHAGLYYPTGSLKATLCVRGKAMLYAYCAERGLPHRGCGKLLVACGEAEVPKLRALQASARANGVDDLRWVEPAELRTMEPALHAVAALHSPSSGIVDSHALMTSLLGDAEHHGATLGLTSPVRRMRHDGRGWCVQIAGSGDDDDEHAAPALRARWVVNAAGLGAQALARRMHGFPPSKVPRPVFAKGHYYALQGRAPFTRLVYPMPADGGLGVHLTLDLAGQARFGPDVQWLPADADPAALDYTVDPARSEAFYGEIRRYWPALPDGALVPAYTGIRPKLSGPGEPAADFRIDGPAEHGVPGVVQLFGIESPGLTASLAIGEVVAGIVGRA